MLCLSHGTSTLQRISASRFPTPGRGIVYCRVDGGVYCLIATYFAKIGLSFSQPFPSSSYLADSVIQTRTVFRLDHACLHLLALWGNKNWPPSMKVKQLENFQDKSGSKGCKCSRLNGPGTQIPLSHPILKLGEFPFPHYWLSVVIRIGLPV